MPAPRSQWVQGFPVRLITFKVPQAEPAVLREGGYWEIRTFDGATRDDLDCALSEIHSTPFIPDFDVQRLRTVLMGN